MAIDTVQSPNRFDEEHSVKSNLKALQPISTFNMNGENFYDLSSKDCSWLEEILGELNENIEDLSTTKLLEEVNLNLELTVSRDDTTALKDHLVLSGEIKAHYLVPCVRCLETMVNSCNTSFTICFVDQELAEEPSFENIDTVICQNQEMPVYFYSKRMIDLKEAIHEQLYLYCNQNPIHSEECKGLCQQCGHNLNLGNCKHHK